MVDVPLQGQDLLHVVFFLLLVLLDLERGPTHFFLRVLHLAVKFSIFRRDSLDSVFETFNLQARVSVVSQDVFFFDLESTDCLLCAPLLID